MDGNKDDAVKCLRIGKEALESGDRTRALKFLNKARRLDPSLPIDDLLSKASSTEEGSSSSTPWAETPATDADASSSSSPASSSTVRHRKPDASSKASVNGTGGGGGGGYTEEQVEVVREIKRKQKDYYSMLGLEKTCTVEDVRKAYRKLSLKVHPDKNKAPGAEEAFKFVSKAFQCLSDEESRKRYDLVGSDEPVTHRRAATRHRGGYQYEDEFDADEIFRNFFYGGMAPATTPFGTFHFQMGRQHRHGARDGSGGGDAGGSSLRMFMQILPVIILLLLNFLPSSDPIYMLSRQYPYEHKMQTGRGGVSYYVKSAEKFEHEYPYQSGQRAQLEHRIERDYVGVVSQNCRVELQRRQWGLSRETPHCDLLRKYEEAVSTYASA